MNETSMAAPPRDARAPEAAGPARPVIRLRSLTRADLPLVETWWNEAAASYLDGADRTGPAPDFRERFVEDVRHDRHVGWSIIEADRCGPVGYVLFRTRSKMPLRAEVALRISERFWGRGFGRAALTAFLDRLFAELHFEEAWLTVYVFNRRAVRLYEGLGFGIVESFTDERGRELFTMSLARSGWVERGTPKERGVPAGEDGAP